MRLIPIFQVKVISNNESDHKSNTDHYIFTLIGQFVETEVRSSHGRADAVVKTQDAVYVFEFKLNGTAEEALKQIDDKGYLIPYQLDNKQLVKIGVNFIIRELQRIKFHLTIIILYCEISTLINHRERIVDFCAIFRKSGEGRFNTVYQ